MKVTFPKEPTMPEEIKFSLKSGGGRYFNPHGLLMHIEIPDHYHLYTMAPEAHVCGSWLEQTTGSLESLFYRAFNEQADSKDKNTYMHKFLLYKFGPDAMYWFYKLGGSK